VIEKLAVILEQWYDASIRQAASKERRFRAYEGKAEEHIQAQLDDLPTSN
jgi:hypothetical protein